MVHLRIGDLVSCDHYEAVKTLRGNKYVLVFTEHSSKAVRLFAVPDTSAATAVLCLNAVFRSWGVTLKLLCDHGTAFVSELFTLFCKRVGVKQIYSTVGNSDSNGATERFNRVIREYIAKVTDAGFNWDLKLENLEFEYNTAVHAGTGVSPWEFLHGWKPRLVCDVAIRPQSSLEADVPENSVEFATAVELYKDVLSRARSELYVKTTTKMQSYAEKMKGRIEAGKKLSKKNFSVGSLVLVFNGVKKGGIKPKFDANLYVGPFLVRAVLPYNKFLVQDVSAVDNRRGRPRSELIKFLKPFVCLKNVVDGVDQVSSESIFEEKDAVGGSDASVVDFNAEMGVVSSSVSASKLNVRVKKKKLRGVKKAVGELANVSIDSVDDPRHPRYDPYKIRYPEPNRRRQIQNSVNSKERK